MRPERVVPVSAELDDVVGRDLCVLSIEVRPTWFFLHLGGGGGLDLGVDASGPGETMPRLRRRWTAEDDRGNRYDGTVKSAHSGWPWTIDATLEPALDPAATALTLEFPNPFGRGIVRTRFDLPEGTNADLGR